MTLPALILALLFIAYRIHKERALNEYSLTILFWLGLGAGLLVWLVAILIK